MYNQSFCMAYILKTQKKWGKLGDFGKGWAEDGIKIITNILQLLSDFVKR